jgi:predicted adenylyl cyclase CyaB
MPEHGPLELEAKYRVLNLEGVLDGLRNAGFSKTASLMQRDEYWDTPEGLLAEGDWVVRVREIDGTHVEIALKGPRLVTAKGDHSRVELEVPAGAIQEVHASLRRQGYVVTWVLEKFREEYVGDDRRLLLALDLVPNLGHFLEVEGEFDIARSFAANLGTLISGPDPRNYAEILRAEASAQIGGDPPGAQF